MDRIEEAVDILQDVVVAFQKPFNVFFDDVVSTLSSLRYLYSIFAHVKEIQNIYGGH